MCNYYSMNCMPRKNRTTLLVFCPVATTETEKTVDKKERKKEKQLQTNEQTNNSRLSLPF